MSKPNKAVRQTPNKLDKRKKTLIILLEGSFTYNTTLRSNNNKSAKNSSKKQSGQSRMELTRVLKKIDHAFTLTGKRKSRESRESEKKKVLSFPIHLKNHEGSNLEVKIRPYSFEFLNRVGLRYNIILLTNASKMVSFKTK